MWLEMVVPSGSNDDAVKSGPIAFVSIPREGNYLHAEVVKRGGGEPVVFRQIRRNPVCHKSDCRHRHGAIQRVLGVIARRLVLRTGLS